jgi:integrase
MSNESFQSNGASARRKIAREKVAVGVYRRTTSDGRTRYEINYLDSGKLKWETVGDDFAEAKRRRAKLNSKRPEERKAPSRMTFGEGGEAWLAAKMAKLRPRTQALYRDALDLVLIPYFGRTPLAKIDADALATFIRVLQTQGLHCVDEKRPVRPLSKSSVENYCKPLAQTLAYAARRSWIPSNPWSLLTSDDMPTSDEDRKQPHEWTGEEVSSLLAASRRLAEVKGAPEARPYDYSPLLMTVATLGLRLGEALGLRWADFEKGDDADGALLRIERQWLPSIRVGDVRVPARYGQPKTDAGVRTLAVPADLRKALIDLRLASPFSRDEDPIFASRSGTPLGHRNVTRRGFEAARDEAGLPDRLTFHDLRDVYASRLISGGVDDLAVADQMGHKDSRITRQVYAHLYDRPEKMSQVRAVLAGVASGD